MEPGEALAEKRILLPAVGADEIDEVGGGRPGAPQRSGRRQHHALVGERGLGETPSVVLDTDEQVGRQTDVVEEDLVERMCSGHVDDGSERDARQVHRTDEVADPSMLRSRRIRPGDQDAVAAVVTAARPDFRAVDDVGVAVANGARTQRCQIGTGIRLAEELAPLILP